MSENQLDNIALFKYFFLPETKNLTSSERLVALCLAHHRNNISMLCCPSIDTMKKEIQIAKSTVILAIRGLIKKDIIVKLQIKRINTSFANNQYYFMYDIEHAKTIRNNDDSIFCNHHDQQVENFDFCLAGKLF